MAKKASKPAAGKSASSKKTPPKGKPSNESAGIDFNSALGGLEDAWGESREKPPTTFSNEPPDVPDDDYVVQLSGARVGQYKTGDRKGVPFVRFRYTIVVGQYTGEVLSSSDDMSTEEAGNTGKTKLDFLSDRLQRMGIDTRKMSLKELPSLCQFLMDTKSNPNAKPFFRVSVKNSYAPKRDNPDEQVHYQQVYINDCLHPDDVKEMMG